MEPRHPPIPPSIRILTRSFTPVLKDFCRGAISDRSSLFSNILSTILYFFFVFITFLEYLLLLVQCPPSSPLFSSHWIPSTPCPPCFLSLPSHSCPLSPICPPCSLSLTSPSCPLSPPCPPCSLSLPFPSCPPYSLSLPSSSCPISLPCLPSSTWIYLPLLFYLLFHQYVPVFLHFSFLFL